MQCSSFTAGMVKGYTDVLRGMGHEVEIGSWDDSGCDRVGFIKVDGVFLVRNSKINFDSFGPAMELWSAPRSTSPRQTEP